MGRRDLLFIVVSIVGVLALVARIAPQTRSRDAERAAASAQVADDAPAGVASSGDSTADATVDSKGRVPARELAVDEAATVAAVDALFRQQWERESQRPAAAADELMIVRRLSLALTGTIPSLAEIRSLESVPATKRIAWWRERLLAERRTADYLAERLARPLVGIEDGPFLIFRRRRFVTWLADAVAENRPYDAIVRDLIASSGLWTDQPATNFLTAAWVVEEKRIDANRLASRVSRAFLGTRIDCAECHDHPFDRWKQTDFRGLAAFFADTRQGVTGIYDRVEKEAKHAGGPMMMKKQDAGADETSVAPSVPFASEFLPEQGTPRVRLAAWVTDARNKPLARVTVNRLWGVMFGRALVEPIDSIPLAGQESADAEAPLDSNAVLELLADDFARHGFNLRRTIRILAALEVMTIDSRDDVHDSAHESADESAASSGETDTHMAQAAVPTSPGLAWNVFPLTRLRPEQLAYSIAQASSLETIDPESSPVIGFLRSVGRAEFVKRFGDAGDAEFAPAIGTIPQQLLLLNGRAVQEAVKGVNPINASWRVAALAPDDDRAVEAAYLTVLTRRPTPDERGHFTARLAGTTNDARHHAVEDLFWTLLNSTEFAWNH